MNDVDVSVIVPHFQQLDQLENCLASLERQSFPRDRFEIIVADNETPGGIATIAANYPRIRFLVVSDRGAAPARNAAMAIARGRIITFTDADCQTAPTWLDEGVKGLEHADLVGGSIEVTVRDPENPSPVESFEKVFAFQQKDYVNRKGFAATANLFATRSAVEATGSFINGISEDVNWCHRAVALGFHLAFNDKAIIRHPARREWSELVRKWDRIINEHWNGAVDWKRGAPESWIALAALTALSPFVHFMKVLLSVRLRGLNERAAAISVLMRIRWWRARRMLGLWTKNTNARLALDV